MRGEFKMRHYENSDLFLIALYDVLGTMWEDYNLPAKWEGLWHKIDKMVNERDWNWELYREINYNEYWQARKFLENVYC